MQFFCFTAHPVPNSHQIYLLGKQDGVSCCVIVYDIRRSVHLLPNTDHSPEDIAKEHQLDGAVEIKSMAFTQAKTHKAAMLHIRPKFTEKVQVGTTSSIKEMFGTQTSALETMLLTKKLKFPLWLEFDGFPVSSPTVNCQRVYRCPEEKIAIASPQRDAALVSILAIHVDHEVAYAYLPTGSRREFGTCSRKDFVDTHMAKMDPDVLVVHGHGIRTLFDEDNANLLGRFKRSREPTNGRLVVDIQKEAAALTKATDYSIEELAVQELQVMTPKSGPEKVCCVESK